MTPPLTAQQRDELTAMFGKGAAQTANVRLPLGTVAVLEAIARGRDMSWATYSAAVMSSHAWEALHPELGADGQVHNPLLGCPERIIKACGWLGLPLDELALHVPGLHLSTLADAHTTLRALEKEWQWENTRPKFKTLNEAGRVLGVRTGWILGMDPAPGLPPLVAGNDVHVHVAWQVLQAAGEDKERELVVYGSAGRMVPERLVLVTRQVQPVRTFQDGGPGGHGTLPRLRVLADIELKTAQSLSQGGAILALGRALWGEMTAATLPIRALNDLASGQLHPAQAAQQAEAGPVAWTDGSALLAPKDSILAALDQAKLPEGKDMRALRALITERL